MRMINNITCNSNQIIFSPPHMKQNNGLVLQPLQRWCLVSANYLSTNYPQTLSLPATAGAAWKKEQNRGRRSGTQADERKGGMRRKLLLMEMKLKLIKKQTNKPPTKVTPRANVQLNSCSRGERDKKIEAKCLKWETWLCMADIFTPLCAGSKAVQLPLRFMWSFRFPPLVFLFYFGVKVSKWACETELLVHVALTKPTLHQSYQRINRGSLLWNGLLYFPAWPWLKLLIIMRLEHVFRVDLGY